jgi:hypothetical protein
MQVYPFNVMYCDEDEEEVVPYDLRPFKWKVFKPELFVFDTFSILDKKNPEQYATFSPVVNVRAVQLVCVMIMLRKKFVEQSFEQLTQRIHPLTAREKMVFATNEDSITIVETLLGKPVAPLSNTAGLIPVTSRKMRTAWRVVCVLAKFAKRVWERMDLPPGQGQGL